MAKKSNLKMDELARKSISRGRAVLATINSTTPETKVEANTQAMKALLAEAKQCRKSLTGSFDHLMNTFKSMVDTGSTDPSPLTDALESTRREASDMDEILDNMARVIKRVAKKHEG